MDQEHKEKNLEPFELPKEEKKVDFSTYSERESKPPIAEMNEELSSIQDALAYVYGESTDMSQPFAAVRDMILNPKGLNPQKLEDELDKITDAFGMRKKLLRLATMSIMEWCQTYGCPRETELKAREWAEELEHIKEEEKKEEERLLKLVNEPKQSLRSFIAAIKDTVKKGVKVAPNLYLTTFLFSVKRANEYLSNENIDAYLGEVSLIPSERLMGVNGSALAQLINDNKIEAAQHLLKELEKAHQPFLLRIEPKGKISLEAPLFSVEASKEAELKIEREKGRIKITFYKKADPLMKVAREVAKELIYEMGGEIKNEDTSSLVFDAEADGDIKRLVINAKEEIKVLVNGKLVMSGIHTFKGPLKVEIVSKYGRVTYTIKEPLILHLELRKIINKVLDEK